MIDEACVFVWQRDRLRFVDGSFVEDNFTSFMTTVDSYIAYTWYMQYRESTVVVDLHIDAGTSL